MARADGRADFLNVTVAPGPVRIAVQQQGLSDSVQFHVFGPPARIEAQAQPASLPADSLAFSQVEIRVSDAWGALLPDGLLVTLHLDQGRLVAEDLYPDQPGVQVQVREGAARALVRAPAQVGTGHLRASAGGVTQELEIHYHTPVLGWTLVGLAQGQAAWNQRRGDGPTGKGFARSQRLSFFTRGTVGAGWLLSSTYDSDRKPADQVFRLLKPEQVYPIYGDASSIFYEAPSASRFYARLERDSTFAQLGDFSTRLGKGELAAYNRSFSGGLAQVSRGPVEVKGFASRTEQTMQVDEIPGQGISGLYYLSAVARGGVVVEGSDQVVIQVRNRLHPEQVLREQRQYRYADYEIDYLAGTLLFKRPVAARSPDENPVVIVATYETAGAASRRWVHGAQVRLRPTSGLELGTTAVREERLGGDYWLNSAQARWRLGSGLALLSEVARSEAAATGWAWKMETQGQLAQQLGYEFYYRRADQHFDNPGSPTVRPGTRKMQGRLRWTPASWAQLSGEAYRSQEGAQGGERVGAALEERVQAGKWAQVLALSGTRRLDQAPRVRSATASAGLEYQLHPRLRLGLGRDQNFGDQELSYRPTLNRVSARWELRDKVALVSEHAFRDHSFTRASYTQVGIESELGEDLEAHARYELDSGLRQPQNQALVGLRHRYRPRPDLTLHTTFERMHALRGDRRGDFYSYSLAAEYLPARAFKGSARFERRQGRTLDKTVASGAMDFSLARSWALLARHTFTEESRPVAGANQGQQRQQASFGLVYRGYSRDWLNLLGKYEYRRDQSDGLGQETQRHLGSLEAIVELWAGMEAYGRCAFKLNTLEAEARSRTRTELWQGSLRQEWGDWDALAEYRLLVQRQARDARQGAAVELGCRLAPNLRLGLGYNLAGYDDRDLAGLEYWSRGPYLKVQMKFSENGVGAVLDGLRTGLR